jgi:uncharacterized protein (DUF3820 family)
MAWSDRSARLKSLNADRAGRFRWIDGQLAINFGKKKGTRVLDLMRDDPSFLKWIVRSDFPMDTRAIAENALTGVLPEPPRPKTPTPPPPEE